MVLDARFHFSQYNLQDYADCPRRFQLRHLQHLQWPAVQTAPVIEQEKRMERGTLFHRMVQQYVNGIPAGAISRHLTDPILRGWWETFLEKDPLAALPNQQLTEYTLSAPFNGYRLLAKFDLLAVENGSQAILMDWKTSEHRPKTDWLNQRIQSRLYPLLLTLGGARLNHNTSWQPEQIELNYWFVQFPADPERLPYNQARYQRDHQFISALIDDIVIADEKNNFPMTSNEKRCDYCQYRSYCERGVAAGTFDELIDSDQLEEDQSLNVDFEQIGEIAF